MKKGTCRTNLGMNCTKKVAATQGAVFVNWRSVDHGWAARAGSPAQLYSTRSLFTICIKFSKQIVEEWSQANMGTNTVKLHRVLRAKPERVFRAFTESDAMAKWLPPNGFTGHVHEMNAQVGGSYRMSFTNFSSGKSHSFGGEFLEVISNERLRYTDRFDDPSLPGEMETTVVLKEVSLGTELYVEQIGIPEMIPVEACYLGWQESLKLLALLVEAEVPDE